VSENDLCLADGGNLFCGQCFEPQSDLAVFTEANNICYKDIPSFERNLIHYENLATLQYAYYLSINGAEDQKLWVFNYISVITLKNVD
jgi:hypothetical protein